MFVRLYRFTILLYVSTKGVTVKAVHICRCEFIFSCEQFSGISHFMVFFIMLYFISLLFGLLFLDMGLGI